MRFRRAKSVVLIIVTLCLACPAKRGGAQSSQADSSIAAIQSLIRSKQYDQALARTHADLKKTPADYRLWTVQGIAFSLKGDSGEALNSFDRALRLSPSYMPALKAEAEILFGSGDKRAEPVLEKILKSDPRDLTAHEMLATLAARSGDCNSASVHFAAAGDAIKGHPQSLEAYGACLFQQKQLERAAPVFEQLVSLLPNRIYPRYDLAVVQISGKQYEAAIETLQPLLTEDQKDADVLSLASQAYEAVKQTPKAVALLRQAIVLNPRNPAYYAAFASLCLEHDSFQVGVDMMNVGLKNIPDDPSLYLSRGLLYVELADFERAEADFARVEKLSSFQALGSYALDLTDVQKNDPQQALARVRSQLKTHPDDPLLNYFLAQSLMNHSPDPESKELKEAKSAALKAEALKPDYVPAHDLLAAIYLQMADYARAIDECRSALGYDPADETATYHLLMALKHSGRTEELAAISKRLAQLHRESLQHENDRKSFRLVEGSPDAHPPITGDTKQSP